MVFGYNVFNGKVENNINDDVYSNGYVGDGLRHGQKKAQIQDEFLQKKIRIYANIYTRDVHIYVMKLDEI